MVQEGEVVIVINAIPTFEHKALHYNVADFVPRVREFLSFKAFDPLDRILAMVEKLVKAGRVHNAALFFHFLSSIERPVA